MRISDWSSDVCSSDLTVRRGSGWYCRRAVLLPCRARSWFAARSRGRRTRRAGDRARSEEHTSELQSLMRISYAVFCLKKKKKKQIRRYTTIINIVIQIKMKNQ